MPMSAVPLRASAIPRDEPPVCTSTRTPGCAASNRLPISDASGATVLDPVSTSVVAESADPQPQTASRPKARQLKTGKLKAEKPRAGNRLSIAAGYAAYWARVTAVA